MLTEQQIKYNEETFIELLSSIEREGADIEGLIKKLKNSDFFTAPASTKFHGAYKGGLCQHCLNVYYNLVNQVKLFENLDEGCYDENTIKIVALLHDMSKMNYYEVTSKNKKIYCEDGDKRDELGRFKWISEFGYKKRDKVFTYGNHEANAEFMVRHFIPLTIDESVAIMHHMGGMSFDSSQENIGEIFNEYQLSLLLHIADMQSSYINERIVD